MQLKTFPGDLLADLLEMYESDFARESFELLLFATMMREEKATEEVYFRDC